jgi:hypothetical protein
MKKVSKYYSRKYILLLPNMFILCWIIKVYCFEPPDDSKSMFLVYSIIFLLLYNTYSLLIYFVLKKIRGKHWLIEVIFVLIIIIPFGYLYFSKEGANYMFEKILFGLTHLFNLLN